MLKNGKWNADQVYKYGNKILPIKKEHICEVYNDSIEHIQACACFLTLKTDFEHTDFLFLSHQHEICMYECFKFIIKEVKMNRRWWLNGKFSM